MSLSNYQRRKYVPVVEFVNRFEIGHDTYSFDCDQAGVVNVALLQPEGRANYERCIAYGGPSRIERFEREEIIDAQGTCACKRIVVLDDPMTNRCECGRFYNGSGQELSHPSQWGDETGERFDDDGNQIAGYGEDE